MRVSLNVPLMPQGTEIVKVNASLQIQAEPSKMAAQTWVVPCSLLNTGF